jgi:hypothetical protein
MTVLDRMAIAICLERRKTENGRPLCLKACDACLSQAKAGEEARGGRTDGIVGEPGGTVETENDFNLRDVLIVAAIFGVGGTVFGFFLAVLAGVLPGG